MKLTLDKSRIKPLLCGTLPLLLLSACGGGGSSTPDTGAALPGNNNGEPVVTDTVISGRVADGYLRGATVCVDVNENGACEADEPAAVTGEGGRYTLDKPAEHADKPIIASVPAEAIDEDTGEAICKALLLSTPADRPEFISPITTLVHQEIKKNPNLTSDDAETTVLNELGLADNNTASLFTDYVAEQNVGNAEEQKNYRYLHQTARVIASMMDDIRDSVETVAINGGLDLTGDDQAREALHQLVTQEIRKLLPEISLAVAEKINKEAPTEEGAEPVSITDEVDPDKVAENLRPADLDTDVVDKIEAIRTEAEVRKVAMETLLKDGIYWIEADCSYYDEPCTAEYGHITVTGEDNVFTQTQYEYDHASGMWVERQRDEDDTPYAFALINGQWEATGDGEPTGPVEFLADGGALLTTGEGEMLVYATAADLADTPVGHHFLNRDLPYELTGELDKSTLFPADSVAYRIYINRQSAEHFLFNWPAYGDETADHCAEFGGNCNVIHAELDGQIIPLTTLDHIVESSQQGFALHAVAHHQKLGLPIDVLLTAEAGDGTSLPTKGTANWMIANVFPNEQTYPAPGECEPLIDRPIEEPLVDYEIENPAENIDPAGTVNLADDLTGPPEQQTELPPQGPDYVDPYHPCDPAGLPLPEKCSEHSLQPSEVQLETDLPEECIEPLQLADSTSLQQEIAPLEESTTAEERDFDVSRWRVVSIDGVRMIEIDIPVAVKHSMDIEGASALLLIEHEGFVRRGATISDTVASDQAAYSMPAFETLKAAIKPYLSR